MLTYFLHVKKKITVLHFNGYVSGKIILCFDGEHGSIKTFFEMGLFSIQMIYIYLSRATSKVNHITG